MTGALCEVKIFLGRQAFLNLSYEKKRFNFLLLDCVFACRFVDFKMEKIMLEFPKWLKQVCLLLSTLTFHLHLLAQSNCVRTVRFDYLKAKLDPSICIPHGNHIISIDDNIDLNDDGLLDKVVRWQSVTLADGEMVNYSFYMGSKDGGFSFHNTLSNLKPLYFSDYEGKSENKFLDSIKRKYIHPTLSMVGFERNCVTITFYVKASVLKELFFTYAPEKNSWILTREIQWLAPTIYKSSHKVEYDRVPASATRIEDFNMLKYIGGEKMNELGK